MTEIYAVVTRNNGDTEELTREQYGHYISGRNPFATRERKTYDKYGRVKRIHSRGEILGHPQLTIHTFEFPGDKTGATK